jgi:hypothetical protein
MTLVHSDDFTPIWENIEKLSLKARDATTSDPNNAESLTGVARKINLLEILIMNLVDDEVLYTFPQAQKDLIAAHWLIATGYYRAATLCLIDALDFGTLGLYFLLRSAQGKQDYQKWENGNLDAPSWDAMRPVLEDTVGFKYFKQSQSRDVFQQTYEVYNHLCEFTQSRSNSPKSEPSPTHCEDLVEGNFPGYDKEAFSIMIDHCHDVIEEIARLWLVGYPHVIKTHDSTNIDLSSSNEIFRKSENRVFTERAYLEIAEPNDDSPAN